MLSPSGISLHARTSLFRVVRHVFLHDFFVVGTFVRHLSSLVKHFVAHFSAVGSGEALGVCRLECLLHSSFVPAHCL